MHDVLLLAVVAAFFALGWFLIGKLDCFLKANHHSQEMQPPFNQNTLRLGFCNPTAADSITDALEQYSKLYPDTSVYIFCGSEDVLLKNLSTEKLDMIFLTENTEIPTHMHYNSKLVSLDCTPVMMKYGGLPIEPIVNRHVIQHALWIGKTASTFANYFIN